MALIGATPGRPGEHLIFSKCQKMLATAGRFLKLRNKRGLLSVVFGGLKEAIYKYQAQKICLFHEKLFTPI